MFESKDPDKDNPELRKALDEAFQKNLPEEFRTFYKKNKPLKGTWDNLLHEKEYEYVRDMQIDNKEKCPYLKKAIGSQTFYYCQATANEMNEDGPLKFSKGRPGAMTAEMWAHTRISELKHHCLGNNYSFCEVYERYEKKDKELEEILKKL